MRWRMLVAALSFVLVLLPSVVTAQEPDEDSGFVMQVSRDVHVASTEEVGTVVVINADAYVDGSVRNGLVVINGKAVVNGRAPGDVTVIKGDLELGPQASVHNVNLFRSNLARDPGATVTGTLHQRSEFGFSWVFWWFFWIGMSVAVLAAGLLFAAVGGRQMSGAARLVGERPAETILGAVIVAIGLPLLAVAAIVTVIGIPLGIAVLLFLLPALWFIGYLVAGLELGSVLLRAAGRPPRGDHPYVETIVGLVLFQAAGLIPFLGGLVVVLAGLLGAGALVIRLWQGWRGAPASRARPAPAM